MPSAAVEGIEINYRIEGNGPETLVLVNGLADDLGTWGHQVPAFVEAGYRVLVFDNPGRRTQQQATSSYRVPWSIKVRGG